MGPTNVALVNLFKADQRLRDAQERLDAAARGVRVQERRTNDLAERLRLAHAAQMQQQSRYAQLELDIRSRDAHIEKLRTQQQTAKNNKEYQAFLVEISTQKVDRGKVEDEAMRLVEVVDKAKAEVASLQSQLDAERARLETMKGQINDELARLQKEVDALMPEREAAANAVSPKGREVFERLAQHHEGEAMSAIGKPDRRREDYLCMACNMELAQDVYNKLKVRDELVYCPSCRRILYIPDEFSPEVALGTQKKPPAPRKAKVVRTKTTKERADVKAAAESGAGPAAGEDVVVIEPRAKGRLGEALAKAQGGSVQRAIAAGHEPFEFEVHVDGNLAGIYKGISAENLERNVKFTMNEMGLPGEVRVIPVGITTSAPPAEAAPTESASESSPSGGQSDATEPASASQDSASTSDVVPRERQEQPTAS